MITTYLPNLLPKHQNNNPVNLDTDLQNMDSPEFDTRLRTGKRATINLSMSLEPTALMLRVTFEPVPFGPIIRAIQATYVNHEHPYKTINYVDAISQTCASVKINYNNSGEITFADTVINFEGYDCNDWILNNHQAELFNKPFAIPKHQNLTVRQLTRNNKRTYYSAPRYPEGIENKEPIFCYGAFCHTNSRVEDIVPYYAIIRPAANLSTCLDFKKQTTWHAEGVYEHIDSNQEYYFHDEISPLEKLTLADSIRLGFCQVNLNLNGETVTFKSYKFDQVSSNTRTLNIYFKPQ